MNEEEGQAEILPIPPQLLQLLLRRAVGQHRNEEETSLVTLFNRMHANPIHDEEDALPVGEKPRFQRTVYGLTPHVNHLHIARTVPYSKYKRVKERLKALETKVEALWDAPGMPGANAIQEEIAAELPQKRVKR